MRECVNLSVSMEDAAGKLRYVCPPGWYDSCIIRRGISGKKKTIVFVLRGGMIFLKNMSGEYMVFDRSGCSERIILFHDRDFSISAFENDGFELEGNGFKKAMALGVCALKNAKLSRGMSMLPPPLLEEEFSWVSSSSEVAASMADEKAQQQHVEMGDSEESNCYCGEDIDEIDALLNLGDTSLVDTADSMEAVSDHRSQKIEETFKMLRDLVGGDLMDPVDVLDEAIRRVKKLQMDLKNLNGSRDI